MPRLAVRTRTRRRPGARRTTVPSTRDGHGGSLHDRLVRCPSPSCTPPVATLRFANLLLLSTMSLCTLPHELFHAVVDDLVRWPASRKALLPLRSTCRALDERTADRLFGVSGASLVSLFSSRQDLAVRTSIAEDGSLERTLDALSRIGRRVRSLVVSIGPAGEDWGAERRVVPMPAILLILDRCLNILVIKTPVDARLAGGLHNGLSPRLKSLSLIYETRLTTPAAVMAPVLFAESLSSLRALALRGLKASTSRTYALFSALACT